VWRGQQWGGRLSQDQGRYVFHHLHGLLEIYVLHNIMLRNRSIGI